MLYYFENGQPGQKKTTKTPLFNILQGRTKRKSTYEQLKIFTIKLKIKITAGDQNFLNFPAPTYFIMGLRSSFDMLKK